MIIVSYPFATYARSALIATGGSGDGSGPSTVVLKPMASSDAGAAQPFGFAISGADNQTVVIEFCTNLAEQNWVPIAIKTLTTGDNLFSDPQWTNYPAGFYRVRMP